LNSFKLIRFSTILIIISAFLFSCKYGEKEIIVLPHNYVGYVVIIYNQKAGSEKNYFAGKRVYEIPGNGILKTRFSGNYGDIGLPEFYYDKITPIHKIPYTID
jgi:uncharacterized protein DUF6843